MRRSSIPAGLGRSFTVTDASAVGVSASRLRAKDLIAAFRGVRVRPHAGADSVQQASVFERTKTAACEQARIYSLVMPDGQFFTHVTAALLWDLPLPARLLLPGADGEEPYASTLDVGVFSPTRTPRGSRIRGHQLLPTHATVRLHDTLPVASPASTWAMLASIMTNQRDIVALGDAVVREPMFDDDRPALVVPTHLEAVVHAGRRRGIDRLRRALPLIRTRSASSRESWCRLALIDAGLPEPELNWIVLDETGRAVACVDLAYPRMRIAIEYEGEHHLIDPMQWAKDIARHADLAEHGWLVMRVTKAQLDAPEHLAARVRRSIAGRR